MGKRSRLYFAMAYGCIFLLGCGAQETISTESGVALVEDLKDDAAAETEQPQENMDKTPKILTFVDAHEQYHEVEIHDDWQMHSYDLSAFHKEDGVVTYASESEPYDYCQGIDVSAYQGSIDWERVRDDGISFVFVRAGFRGYGEAGNLRVDDRAIQNIKGAKNAGLSVGVYFFSQAVNEEEAEEEAEFVFSILEEAGIGPDELELPIVFDPESILDDEARTDTVTGEQFTANSVAFCEKVIEKGYRPMIYCNMMWQAYQLDLDVLKKYPIWYADYEDAPQTPYAFTIWQYSEEGSVDGIDGPVDRNLMLIKEEAKK